MIRSFLGLPALVAFALLLAACTPTTTTTSGSGVGFQDYGSYVRGARQGAGATAPAAEAEAGFDPAAAAAAINRAEGAGPSGPVMTGDDPNRPRGDAPAGIRPESGEVANSGGISDEQDFDAVSARETIESDAERIARNRAEYVVVQPRDLPQRPGDTGPNIVEFALATKHAPGVQLYRRSGLQTRDQAAACARYASPDLAQQDFLARGGPERDRLGVDPDGDGFACAWDPRPFRTVLQ